VSPKFTANPTVMCFQNLLPLSFCLIITPQSWISSQSLTILIKFWTFFCLQQWLLLQHPSNLSPLRNLQTPQFQFPKWGSSSESDPSSHMKPQQKTATLFLASPSWNEISRFRRKRLLFISKTHKPGLIKFPPLDFSVGEIWFWWCGVLTVSVFLSFTLAGMSATSWTLSLGKKITMWDIYSAKKWAPWFLEFSVDAMPRCLLMALLAVGRHTPCRCECDLSGNLYFTLL